MESFQLENIWMPAGTHDRCIDIYLTPSFLKATQITNLISYEHW